MGLKNSKKYAVPCTRSKGVCGGWLPFPNSLSREQSIANARAESMRNAPYGCTLPEFKNWKS